MEQRLDRDAAYPLADLPVGQGEEAINAAYLLVKKEPNPKVANGIIWIPYQKITKENYKSFMK